MMKKEYYKTNEINLLDNKYHVFNEYGYNLGSSRKSKTMNLEKYSKINNSNLRSKNIKNK